MVRQQLKAFDELGAHVEAIEKKIGQVISPSPVAGACKPRRASVKFWDQ